MGEMANRIAARIAEDGGGDPADDVAAVPGTGNGDLDDDSPRGDTTDTGRQGPPESIPYSRFAEVNSRLQQLRDYEQLAELGIEPDSAVRLANFEAAYVQDPKGIISTLIDNQQDLTDEAKTAMKSLLVDRAGADESDDEDKGDASLSEDDRDRLAYVDQLRTEREQAESQQRLDVVVRHWGDLDTKDGVKVPERSRLVYIQAAASRGGFETLEQLAEAARAMYYEDRDASLGEVIQSRDAGTPRTVPGSAAAPSPPTEFKDFKEARKQILADIREGRLPGITMEG